MVTPGELIMGPEITEPPYPLKLSGLVTKGYGRGSKDLGIPTGEQSFHT